MAGGYPQPSSGRQNARAHAAEWRLPPPRRMPDARPRSQDEHQLRVAQRTHLAPLGRFEMRQKPWTAPDGLTVVSYLDLTVGDQQVRTLVHLVLLELLASRQVNRDRTRLLVGAQHLRMMGLDRQ